MAVAIPASVAVLGGLAFGNYECYIHKDEITSHLVPPIIHTDTNKVTEAQGISSEIIDQIAEEGITLIKNENKTLPLTIDENDDDTRYVNLFGIGSTDAANGFMVFGAGSGAVTLDPTKRVTLKQGLENAGYEVNSSLYDYFKKNKDNPDKDWWTNDQQILRTAKAYSSTAIVTISRLTGENLGDAANAQDTSKNSTEFPYNVSYTDNDKDGRNFCQLSLREEARINWVSENFEKVIVLINSGNRRELGSLAKNPKAGAVLITSYTGQNGGNAIGKIISGKVNPSGRLTDTYVYDTKQDPTWRNAFVKDDNGKQITYTEDIYTGYRYYETADYDGYFTSLGKTYDDYVFRPYGYGLSYTTFEWSNIQILEETEDNKWELLKTDSITDKSHKIRVQIEVKNTGSVAGKEVVQLYYTAPYTKGGIEKAYVSRLDFGKTDILYPESESGEGKPNSQVLTLEFTPYDMASYDCYDKNSNGKKGWELEGGKYEIKLQNNAHELNSAQGSKIEINVPSEGYYWDKDPDTNGEVKNRFTGDTAENNIPIDGNSNGDAITYFSRSDFSGTFPTAQTPNRTSGADSTKEGTYVTDEEYYKDVQRPQLDNKESNLLLYTLKDGSKADSHTLQWVKSDLVRNEELVRKLGENYDAPEWEQLLSQLSWDEVTNIVCRASMGTQQPAVSIGKPSFIVNDGPQGLNTYTQSFEDLQGVSAFPAETLVGMTYNKDLARQEGAAMAGEAKALGRVGLYAPAVDLHRHAYNGRNYEQYGEDPYLCGIMGGNRATGAITHGAQVSIKHLVLSQPGRNPRDYNTWLTEQNLRENYLKPFEIAIKKSKANFVMTAFNNIGGVRCAYSYQLNNGILRDEWGFTGSIVTDYNVSSSSRTTASLIRSGNDLRFISNDVTNELDYNNDVDVYLAVQSVKRDLYSFCNTYYRTKTYDPSFEDTTITSTQPFVWWIPTLIAVDVVFVLGRGVGLFFLFKPKRKKTETEA